MRNLWKHGFTIVELVIVIAVIAILAGVLVPTFSDLVATSKIKKDTSFCVNVNKELFALFANGDSFTPTATISKLLEYGYDIDDFVPSLKGNYFVYDETNRRIALLDENFKVLYSDGEMGQTLWVLVTSLDIVDSLPETYNILGFLLIKTDAVTAILRNPEIIRPTDNELQEAIYNSFSVETVIQLPSDLTRISDIVIGETNALTLDLASNSISFESAKIINLGTLQLKNGKIIAKNDVTTILNSGNLYIENVTLHTEAPLTTSVPFTTNNAAIKNLGNASLKIVDCDFNTENSPTVHNEKDGYIEIRGGEYTANSGSTINNSGKFKIYSGNFYREVHQKTTGNNADIYSVISNAGTDAHFEIFGGTFTNKYTSRPNRRRCVTLYNNAGSMILNAGTFENKCNANNGSAVLVEDINSKVDFNGGQFIVANLQARCVANEGENNKSITINVAQFVGGESLIKESVSKESVIYYAYKKNEIPNILVTKSIPQEYELQINNEYYLDMSFLDVTTISPNVNLVINKVLENIDINLAREYYGEENKITIVYRVEMPEIVSAATDFILKKKDCTANYPNAFCAYEYYTDINETSATFMATYANGQISYFSVEEFSLACVGASRLTLLKDINTTSTEYYSWNATNDIIFDLNGKQWEENGNIPYMFLLNNSSNVLTIMDSSQDGSGKIIFDSQSGIAIFALIASMVVEGGTYISNCDVFYLHGTDDNDSAYYQNYIYEIKYGTFYGGVKLGGFTYIGRMIISGGNFNFDPSPYLLSGYKTTKIGELYVVMQDSASPDGVQPYKTSIEKYMCDNKKYLLTCFGLSYRGK